MRPIALQDNLAKTQAAERMNQIQKAHGEMEQRLAADALKQKTTADMEKARESEKTDMLIIREEQEKEKRDKHKQKDDENESEDQKKDKSQHLDLKG